MSELLIVHRLSSRGLFPEVAAVLRAELTNCCPHNSSANKMIRALSELSKGRGKVSLGMWPRDSRSEDCGPSYRTLVQPSVDPADSILAIVNNVYRSVRTDRNVLSRSKV